MGKGCLNKLTASVNPCAAYAMHGVKEIYLIYPEDITSITIDPTGGTLSAIGMAETAKSYRVSGHKQLIQVTESLSATDISNAIDPSITFRMPASFVVNGNAIRNGKFAVLVVFYDLSAKFYGYPSPLVCTGWEGDSNANGRLITVTLGQEEGSIPSGTFTASTGVQNVIIGKVA